MRSLAFLLSLSPLLLPTSAQKTCSNYGSPSSTDPDVCVCPPGFLNSTDCSQPQCGGNLLDAGSGTAPLSTAGGLGNVTAGGCACEDGWAGPVCSVCTSTQACTSLFPSSDTSSSPLISIPQNSDLSCSSSAYTYASSQLLCNVLNPTLQAVFSGKSELGITRTVDPGDGPSGRGNRTSGAGLGSGVAYAQLWYEGVEQFGCRATSCTQSDYSSTSNSSTFTCPDLACTCLPGTTFCSQLGGVIDGLTGPLEITCSSPSGSTSTSTSGSDELGSCTFSQALLKQLFPPDGLSLVDCRFGECVSQTVVDRIQGNVAPSTSGSTSGDGDGLSGGVIAGLAVVGAIIAAILGLLLWGILARNKARKQSPAGMGLDESGFGRKKGMGAGIEWTGVGYRLRRSTGASSSPFKFLGSARKERPEGKVILEGISGKMKPGGLCCVLGPSGAGKSTFVDILAGRRKTVGKVVGKVDFFGQESGGGGGTTHRVGFVDQEDVLNPTSTVRETLLFAARLRLPESVSDAAKQERVFKVINDLGLVDVADVRIGDGIKRGVSGGERRRVSIGVELVAAPDVLILDEPTSGLDSVSAAKVVAILRDLARDPDYPTTIVASIHQPSSRLYQSFDTVLVLAHGRQVYFGPGGHAPAEYFEQRGMACPPGYNVADHLLEIASSPLGVIQSLADSASPVSTQTQEDSPVKGTALRMQETPGVLEKGDMALGGAVPTLNDASTSQGSGSDSGAYEDRDGNVILPVASKISHRTASTFFTQLEVLSGRELKNLKRQVLAFTDWSLLITHIITACILGVFAGGLYYKVDLSIAGFQNRVGSLFFLGSLIAFSTLSALYNLINVRALFLRERAGSYYSPLAWLLSRILFDLIPLRLIPTIIVTTIVYFMVGLDSDAARFFKCLLIFVEFSLTLTLFNMLLAAVLPNGGITILLSSLHNLYLMTYAGFFVNLGKIPPVLRWLRWFDVLGYALEATVVNEVGAGLEIVDTLAAVPVRISATLIMDTLFGFGLGHYYRNVLVLFAFIAGYGALLVMAVWFLMRETR